MKGYKIIIGILLALLLILSLYSFRFVQKDYIEISYDLLHYSTEELYGQIEYLSRVQEMLKEGRSSEVKLLFEGYKSAVVRNSLYKVMRPYVYNNFKNIYSEEIYLELDGILEEIADTIYIICDFVIEENGDNVTYFDNLEKELDSLLNKLISMDSRDQRTNHDLNIYNIIAWPHQVNSHNEEADMWQKILDFKANMKNIRDKINKLD